MTHHGMLHVGQAAALAGVSRSTMHRALKRGRISYTTNPKGERLVDPAEVARAFPDTVRTVPRHASWNAETQASGTAETPPATPDLARLATAESLAEERGRTIEDLRRRLDVEAEERRRLTLMVTDARPWWRRWWRS
jgi:hypothetical protein